MQKGDNDLMNRRSFLECLGITAIPCLLRAPDNKKEEIVLDKENNHLSDIVRHAYSEEIDDYYGRPDFVDIDKYPINTKIVANEIGRLFNTRVIARW